MDFVGCGKSNLYTSATGKDDHWLFREMHIFFVFLCYTNLDKKKVFVSAEVVTHVKY